MLKRKTSLKNNTTWNIPRKPIQAKQGLKKGGRIKCKAPT